MSDIIQISSLDTDKLTSDTLAKLDRLCVAVFDKKIKDLEKNQLIDLLSMDINSAIETMNIYAQCTRQIEQFNPNSYSAAQTLSFKNSFAYMIEVLKEINKPEEILERYVEMKGTIHKYIMYRYRSVEDFLRDLLKSSEEKDGIGPKGRYAP